MTKHIYGKYEFLTGKCIPQNIFLNFVSVNRESYEKQNKASISDPETN